MNDNYERMPDRCFLRNCNSLNVNIDEDDQKDDDYEQFVTQKIQGRNALKKNLKKMVDNFS